MTGGERRTSPVAGEYVLVRSRRRTVGLEVRPDTTLVVRVPQRLPLSSVESVLRQKAAWIASTTELVLNRASSVPRHDFLTGERFPYLGRQWPFVVVAFQTEPLTFDPKTGFTLDVTAFDQGEAVFERWYRLRARELLTARVLHFAGTMGIAAPRLRITGAVRRWGSCSATGTVCFAWRLIMAPADVIDYVVVHELCHLRAMNHSPDFWAAVASVMPDYTERRKWLRDNGRLLTI